MRQVASSHRLGEITRRYCWAFELSSPCLNSNDIARHRLNSLTSALCDVGHRKVVLSLHPLTCDHLTGRPLRPAFRTLNLHFDSRMLFRGATPGWVYQHEEHQVNYSTITVFQLAIKHFYRLPMTPTRHLMIPVSKIICLSTSSATYSTELLSLNPSQWGEANWFGL